MLLLRRTDDGIDLHARGPSENPPLRARRRESDGAPVRTTDTAVQPCPNCSNKLEAATGVGHDHAPSLGSLSLCFYCGALLQFTAAGLVRLSKVPDDADESTRRTVALAREAILKLRGKAAS